MQQFSILNTLYAWTAVCWRADCHFDGKQREVKYSGGVQETNTSKRIAIICTVTNIKNSAFRPHSVLTIMCFTQFSQEAAIVAQNSVTDWPF